MNKLDTEKQGNYVKKKKNTKDTQNQIIVSNWHKEPAFCKTLHLEHSVLVSTTDKPFFNTKPSRVSP